VSEAAYHAKSTFKFRVVCAEATSAGQVQRIPVEDHCPPLLVEVVRFCEDVTSWMRRDPRNVIAAHCKVLLACGMQTCTSRTCDRSGKRKWGMS
jgi:hypothetical protein